VSVRRALLTAALGSLAACGRPPAHDVAYYAAHPDLRAQRLVDCSDRPGGEDAADCAAALAADARGESQRATRYVRPKSRLNGGAL
jgi:hypothetical protein